MLEGISFVFKTASTPTGSPFILHFHNTKSTNVSTACFISTRLYFHKLGEGAKYRILVFRERSTNRNNSRLSKKVEVTRITSINFKSTNVH